jgi:hypothetical protein
MVVGFTTPYAISAYHHWCCEFESQSGHHDILTEILLKVALNIIQINQPYSISFLYLLTKQPVLFFLSTYKAACSVFFIYLQSSLLFFYLLTKQPVLGFFIYLQSSLFWFFLSTYKAACSVFYLLTKQPVLGFFYLLTK